MGPVKELVKRTRDLIGGLSLGITYKEETKKMKGEFFIKLEDKNGIIEQFHYKNIIVNDASLLIARLLADGWTSVDHAGPAHGLWVLAVGTGDPTWPDKSNPPPPVPTDHKLKSELARKTFAHVNFVKTDGSGLPATEVTNILDFQTVFNESEAVGGITELAMFGGDASDTITDSGTMLNLRHIGIINKSDSSTLSIIFRITC